MDANPRQLSQHCLSTLKVLSMPAELNMKGLHLRFEISIWLRWPLMSNSGQLSSYHLAKTTFKVLQLELAFCSFFFKIQL